MSRIAIQCPPLGVSVFTGTLAEWKVQPGETIQKDQAILVIETDKVSNDVLAAAAGVIDDIVVQAGEVVEPEQVLGYIETSGTRSATAPVPAAATATTNGKSATPPPAPSAPATAVATPVAPPAAATPSSNGHAHGAASADGKPHRYTPRVRRLIREAGLSATELGTIRGTGRHGRVTPADIERFLASGRVAEQAATTPAYAPLAAAPAPAATAAAPAPKPASPVMPIPVPTGEERWTSERLSTIRRTIATYLRNSVDQAVHTVSIDECDVTALLALRKRLNAQVEQRYGLRLTLTTFIAKAVAMSLREFPLLNSILDLDAGEIRTAGHVHLGIAVDAPQGLTVPVVRYADTMGLVALQQEINRVAGLVREGKAQLSDLQGATYTITNAGAEGSIASTPIINYPNVGILGVNKIRRMPVVRNDEIVIRDIMNVSACFDHRLVDGVYNVRFVNRVIGYLEEPASMLL